MKLALTRTAESKGLIYEAADTTGRKVFGVERDVSQHNVWVLHFRHDDHSVQALMRKDAISTEFQTEGGRFYGRLREARFSVAGKIFIEDENGVCLGSLTSLFGKACFKDSRGRKTGFARRNLPKKRLIFIPPSEAHAVWNHAVEIENATYDERFLYALVCLLVTREFATSGS